MNFGKEQKEKMENEVENRQEKPQKLYRGTQKRNISQFDPHETKKYRDKNEGQVIFSTPDKAFATMFLVPEADDRWTTKGRFNGVWYTVIANEKIYRKLDEGGSVYEITDLDDCYCDQEKGMGECEWVSKDIVVPSSEEQYDSGLDVMIENGVQVYFVDNETFIAVKCAKDSGLSILQGIESENQKRNQNVKTLEDDDEEEEEGEDELAVRRDLERFYFSYCAKDYQKFLSELTEERKKDVFDNVRRNIDGVEKFLREESDEVLQVLDEKSRRMVLLLKEALGGLKKSCPERFGDEVPAVIEKLKNHTS